MKKYLLFVLLVSCDLGYAQYTAIPDINFEKALIRAGIDYGSPDGQVLTASIKNLKELQANTSGISDLTGIQDFENLIILSCRSNQMQNLHLSNNKLLQHLNCDDNKMEVLDLSKNKDLQFLNCGGNMLSSLDLSQQASLTYLYCDVNPLKLLNISKNTELLLLYCLSNQLLSLDVTKNLKLRFISCSYNSFTNLDLSNNKDLESIFATNTMLQEVNLKNENNSKITNIDLRYNPSISCIQIDNLAFSDSRWSSKKDATARFSQDCRKAVAAVSPPVINATGNQTYCPGTAQNIVETISISYDPAEPETDAIYIQVSSGYINGQDQLILANPSSHPTISIGSGFDRTTGILKLSSSSGSKVPYADFEDAIKDVQFSNSSPSPFGTRTFSISLGSGQLSYLPRNKHFYEYVPSLGINWTKARDEAASKVYYGVKGYLATLTAADEAQLAGAQAPGAGWIGGSDAETEGTWKWVTGPEGLANGGTGIAFWNGKGNGATTPPFNYANWNISGNEPNDSNNNEDYAHITAPELFLPGTWNDLREAGDPITNPNYYPKGYIVEYGGMVSGDVDNIQISASTTITIPKITSTTPKSICGSGVVTLQATATDGVVSWYDKPTGGTLLQTGNSFITPNLSAPTSYYVDVSNGSCSSRTEVIASVNPIPSIISTTPNSRCDSGTVTLGAVASAGTINWYDSQSGGTLLGTGTSFTIPNISASTIYYVEATSAGCTSLARVPVIATVNVSPTIISITPSSRCDSGTVTLRVVASAGTINWYDASLGGTLVGTGTSFTTPNISASTTYYVEATSAGCSSLIRIPVVATVNISPTITSTTPNSRCDAGIVTLNAVASEGTINWYDAPVGRTLLGTGTMFITPIISITTPYYVEATSAGCISLTRTPVLATVNISPTITSTLPNSRCDSGTVTLGAVASAGTINWYDAPIGGTLLGIGTPFTTPNISASNIYYVEATSAGCISPRLPVSATVYPIQKSSDEVVLCQKNSLIIDASIPGMKYLWSPNGETTQAISVASIGDYSVIISSPLASCDSRKDIKVIEYPIPIIKEIIVAENSITIQLESPQNFYEYAIDDGFFQESNQFYYVSSGQHTAIVGDNKRCNSVSQAFTIFTIAKYFTPNNDGYNDFWEIPEMKNFSNSSALIFNRYGKLLKTLTAAGNRWDGKFNNNLLPADDYWYSLKLDGSKPEIKGHFSLKR